MKTYVFLIILIILFACNEKNATLEKENIKCYPTVVKKDGKPLLVITYNQKNKPVSIKKYDGQKVAKKGEIEYNSEGKKTSLQYYNANDEPTKYVTYDYNRSQLLSRINYYMKTDSGNLVLQRYISYLYNEDGQIHSKYYYTMKDGSAVMKEYYSITYNSAGNATLKKHYNNKGGITSSSTFEFDEANNSFKNLSIFVMTPDMNNNNITKVIVTDIYDNILSDSYSSSYTYNDHNYPVKENRKFIGGKTVVYTYQYKTVNNNKN